MMLLEIKSLEEGLCSFDTCITKEGVWIYSCSYYSGECDLIGAWIILGPGIGYEGAQKVDSLIAKV